MPQWVTSPRRCLGPYCLPWLFSYLQPVQNLGGAETPIDNCPKKRAISFSRLGHGLPHADDNFRNMLEDYTEKLTCSVLG